jgi:hypothetical protein
MSLAVFLLALVGVAVVPYAVGFLLGWGISRNEGYRPRTRAEHAAERVWAFFSPRH